MAAPDSSSLLERRRVLSVVVNAFAGLAGTALAALLGVFALRPATGVTRSRWIRAGTLADLTPDVPVPRVLAHSQVDGWYRARARRTVFLVWDGDRQVRAMSATCTHLGCQVRWDAEKKHFQCPCHGGVYDATGRVLEGPPPRPLDVIDTRIDGADAVLVQL
jgi:menaquinol-cytochrome c reductase iron-sulfur subunit